MTILAGAKQTNYDKDDVEKISYDWSPHVAKELKDLSLSC